MRMINLNWDREIGEGSVKYTPAFEESHRVTQLDMLQDAIYELTKKYEAMLAAPDEAHYK